MISLPALGPRGRGGGGGENVRFYSFLSFYFLFQIYVEEIDVHYCLLFLLVFLFLVDYFVLIVYC